MPNMLNMEDVIIIGAGLSGLSIAYHLEKQNIGFKILEAQNRMGGRIETIFGNQNTPMEMGATWFSKEHKNLIKLLSALNIGYFEQRSEGIALFDRLLFHYEIINLRGKSYRMENRKTIFEP